MSFAPAVADNLVAAYDMCLTKDAVDYACLTTSTGELFGYFDNTFHGQTAQYNTPGTLAAVRASANYDTDRYFIELGTPPTRTSDTTADTSPTGITTLRLGSRTAAATVHTGGFWLCNSRVRR